MSDNPPIPESHRDLLDRNVVALSTINTDGRPQTTAVWLMLDDDGIIRTSLTDDRQKTKNLQARPFGTVFVIDRENVYRTLEVRCDAVVKDDPDLEMMKRIVTHYGRDFDTFPAPREGRIAVDLIPRRVVATG
jgi:PPOX class probable F420-dependent enzyme